MKVSINKIIENSTTIDLRNNLEYNIFKNIENLEEDKKIELLKTITKNVYTTPEGGDPFWSDEAEKLFIAISLIIIKEKEELTLENIISKTKNIKLLKEYLNNIDLTSKIYEYGSDAIYSPKETLFGITLVLEKELEEFTNIDYKKEYNENDYSILYNAENPFQTTFVKIIIEQLKLEYKSIEILDKDNILNKNN